MEFIPGFHLFLGQNAQGKTNLLEAVYLLSTLRSFRGAGHAQMVRQGQEGFFAGGTVVEQGNHEVKFYWSSRKKSLGLDGRPVRKLSEYFGLIQAVVFCTEDLQLIKGAASVRRRFLDLLLAQTQPGYLALLQRFARAVRARNALLKQPRPDAPSLEGFTREMLASGGQVMQCRRDLMPQLAPLAVDAYQRIAPDAEALRLEYQPSVKADFEVELAQSRQRERVLRSTLVGPHRDELRLLLNDRSAAQYGSEGQKRTLAIALKMAQAEYLTRRRGAPPILLIDDVMGELDARRRGGFLPLLEQARHARGQVFMTCTEENWPRELSRDLIRWEVKTGTVKPGAANPAR
jgi:DNA replication and repair protein RecF